MTGNGVQKKILLINMTKGEYRTSSVFVQSDKVKNERRSYPYDPDRTKTNDDKYDKKIH